MNKKYAFTLVELLVVITIIGILAALIVTAAGAARHSVRVSLVKAEVGKIQHAIEQYKTQYGEYPPDFSDPVAVVRHVKKRWPDFNLAGATTTDKVTALCQAVNNVYNSSGIDWTKVQPAPAISGGATFMDDSIKYLGAIPFWLGGFPSDQNDGMLAGFSSDKSAPFGRSATNGINNGSANWTDVTLGSRDVKQIYPFEVGKTLLFVKTTSDCVFPVAVQKQSSDEFLPFIYMRGNASAPVTAYGTGANPKTYDFTVNFNDAWQNLGSAVAYAQTGASTAPVWSNPDTFQLIHPGFDGVFGDVTHMFRSIGAGDLSAADMDNIVNFGDGTTIKSQLP